MTKQKQGFWLFIASLIPGAGELYMGFRKMGLSIMILFWGIVASASILNIAALIFLVPIIWFYSFFNVHNLKSLSEEEFMSVEDDYIIYSDTFVTNSKELSRKYRNILAFLLIILGISGVWHTVIPCFQEIIPEFVYYSIMTLSYRISSVAISILLIIAGVKLIKGKREELDNNENA